LSAVLESVAPAAPARAAAGAESAAECFHCGLPITERGRWQVVVHDVARPLCCAGCAAVAQAIVANGLASWYDHRTQVAARPDARAADLVPQALRDLTVFDDPAVQEAFVTATGDLREAAILLEGLQCPACVWLNESHVRRQPGVVSVDINYTTSRGRVQWDASRTKLSTILAAIEAIGYRAQPYDAEAAEAARRRERRSALWRLFVAGFGMMQVMMYAVPAYLADPGDMTADIEQLMRVASMLLTLPVVAYSAVPFLAGAWRDLAQRRLGMDVPVAIGILAAFGGSVWNTVVTPGTVWFDSVTMFVFFLLGGRWLELAARQRAARVIEGLADRQPVTAERVADYPLDRRTERVAASRLVAGDVVLVKAGSAAPADGVVIEGRSRFDESLVTGESRPVERAVGGPIIGGAQNVAGAVLMRVERVGADTWMAGIARLIERASAERPRLVLLAERYAGAFVAAILALAAIALVGWWQVSHERAIGAAIAILVVTCPCALSLATPLALSAATASLARRGVLVAAPDALERIAAIDHLALDKTGTLTVGRLALVEVQPLAGLDRARCLALAARLDAHAAHPMAQALRAAFASATGDDAAAEAPSDLHEVAGAGVEARVDGRRVRLGAAAFAGALHGQPLPPVLATDAQGLALLADDDGWIAAFTFADVVRAEAAGVLDDLRARGIGASILSGDRPAAVAAVAARLGIADARAALTPEAKRAALAELQAARHVVGMAGDGVNDAPVLAQAHVSFALAGGAPLAQVHADVVLLGDRLDGVVLARAVAERTRRIVRQNLAWAFAYNVAAVPLAAFGWMPAWLAALGMAASSLLVVANSVRLLPAAHPGRLPAPEGAPSGGAAAPVEA
jgi:Cu2+-exporting ATPase